MERNTEIKESSIKVLELKKHVAVIHSSNKLTLLQRKIANALLFNAYRDLQDKDEHTIPISRLCEIIGYDSHDHKRIKVALINLISTVLEWNLVDGERLEGEGVWNASSIIAGASIDGPVCTYSYSSQMRKLLYRPNMYGRLDMQVQSRFQSTYGLALYENCNRFQDIGKTPWFSLTKFRKLMGVEEKKYKIFRDFKTRVLDKAVEEVNKYSPLMISPQLRKQNRQVISIQFLIKKPKEAPIIRSEIEGPLQTDLKDILKMEFNFSAKQIDETISKYDEQFIKEKITIIKNSKSYTSGRIKNLTRYLITALRENYQACLDTISTVQAPDKINKKTNIEIQTKFKRFQEAQLFKLFSELPEKIKVNVISKFEKFLVGMYQQLYSREGLKNILIQEQLCIYLKKTNHELIRQLSSYEEWLETSFD